MYEIYELYRMKKRDEFSNYFERLRHEVEQTFAPFEAPVILPISLGYLKDFLDNKKVVTYDLNYRIELRSIDENILRKILQGVFVIILQSDIISVIEQTGIYDKPKDRIKLYFINKESPRIEVFFEDKIKQKYYSDLVGNLDKTRDKRLIVDRRQYYSLDEILAQIKKLSGR